MAGARSFRGFAIRQTPANQTGKPMAYPSGQENGVTNPFGGYGKGYVWLTIMRGGYSRCDCWYQRPSIRQLPPAFAA
jgi:hypothetical protein